jgi:hypothetical protein
MLRGLLGWLKGPARFNDLVDGVSAAALASVKLWEEKNRSPEAAVYVMRMLADDADLQELRKRIG